MLTRKSRLLLLPMAFVLLAPLCQATSESTGSSTPNFSEAASHVLTPEAFQKFIKAEDKLLGLMDRDSKLEKAIALKGDRDTFEAWLRRIESNSKAVSAIEGAGLTAREYLKTFVAVIQAYAVAGVQKEGKVVPANLQAQVPKENVAFVEGHSAEIEGWAKKWGKGAKAEKVNKVAVKPNTLEDIYIPADSSTPKESSKDKATKNP